MIKTTFKAHPLMIIRLMRPYVFVLILPLIRALVQYVTKGEVDGLLTLELIALVFVVVMAVLGWRAISITIKGRQMALKSGVLINQRSVIDISKLSSVSLKQNIVGFMLGSVDCSINTEAGRTNKSDFSLKLSKSDAKRLYKIIYGQEKQAVIKFSAYRIALLAAATSSAVTGMVVGVPILNKASDLVGVAISDMLLSEINNVSARFDSVFPPVVNTATIILVFAYAASFLASFFKNVNFKIITSPNSIEIRSGVFVRKRTMFKKAKVNNVCFEQTPLMRLLKKYSMRASVGGYGDDRGEKSVVVPVASHNELEESLKKHFPFLSINGESLKPQQTRQSLNRFFYIAFVLALFTIAVGTICVITFPYFDRLIVFLILVLLGIDAYYASVCYHNYKFGELQLGEHLLASGSAGFMVRELYCEKSKIGVIKVIQTPADRRFETCKIKLTVRSEKADSVKVRNIDIKAAKERINKVFDLKIVE